MAGRFPGADDVLSLWRNLIQGRCSIVDIPDQKLNLPADSPLRRNPNLVRRAASISNPELFDARFFGIFPKEAQVMDPQHRIMLECCWHALEDAGYPPDSVPGSVGLFAGCYMDTYIVASLAHNPKLLESLANSFHGGDLQTELGNDKDYLATRVSYLLNLRGPAMTIQTACSTSLVAIIQACQSLAQGQCDMALAGGVTLKLPQNRGYLYAEGGMVSPDGVVRTFDAKARGTVFGEGAAVVVLKRLDDALADGDDIYAVIRGWGLNNDGKAKMGYTAPSADGQFEAIRAAHQMAAISAETIGYMEAHGTGTALGDPIEVDALTRAFRLTTDKKQFCAIGSLKTNIGHLDVAAGAAGLIKVCLALRHEVIPPSLHFESPNPNIDFENSPFFVNTKLRPWKRSGTVRRAGLSSFGVGGTNAHIVIEEPPKVRALNGARKSFLFPLSACSPAALQIIARNMIQYLEEHPDESLDDLAYTLQTGRKRFNYTRAILADSREELLQHLEETAEGQATIRHQVRRDVPCVWMFPGQGCQFINMGRELYDTEPVFAEAMDRCFELLRPYMEFDLREKLFVQSAMREETEQSAAVLKNTQFAQPAIFSVSYAYARWLMACGIRPDCMIGHSVGEFVAACLGGVFSLPDALRMVAYRAKLMQELPPGSMLAVREPEERVAALLDDSGLASHLSIAAVNSPQLCVVSGDAEHALGFQSLLEQRNIASLPLHTSHAFHSSMMDPAIEPFYRLLSTLELKASSIPIVSTVTGKPLSAEQASNPMYWARHLRETVRFSDALAAALNSPRCVLLEVGPGQVLATLARQQPMATEEHTILALSPHAKNTVSASKTLWTTMGALWQAGVPLDFAGAYQREQRRRLHLPGYPFERQRYWFDQIADESPAEAIVEPQADQPLPSSTRAPDPIESAQVAAILAPAGPPVPAHESATRITAEMGFDPHQNSSTAYTSNGAQQVGFCETYGMSMEDYSLQSLIEQQLAIMREQLKCWRNT